MATDSVSKSLQTAIHQLFWEYSKWITLIALCVYLCSGIYKIDRDAIGVLTRFGQIVAPNISPGLHYKLPKPIDTIKIIPIKKIKTMNINDFGSKYALTEGGKSYNFYQSTGLEPYAITGDNNIVATTLVLKYTITDPVSYLYQIKNPEKFVERTAARVIIHNLAKLKIDEILTFGKKQLEFNIQKQLSEELDQYRSGIQISFLEIREIRPPQKVQDAFNRVINAEVDKKKSLNEAQGYYNRVVPQARTAANKTVQEARAYKREKILTAEGETSRFLARFKGYQENPSAHRKKIYIEFINSTYPKLGEIRAINAKESREKNKDFFSIGNRAKIITPFPLLDSITY